MFAEQGYDATTVAEIAERAEVSPRTVALYFRSRQDIAVSKFGEGADRLTFGEGADRLTFGEGAGRLTFGEGADRLTFSEGADRLAFGEGADRLTEAMRNRSPDERAVDVLGRWLLAEHQAGDDEMVELERRMFVANPELAALRTARMDAAVRESTRVVAEDLGVAPEAAGPSVSSPTRALRGPGVVLALPDLLLVRRDRGVRRRAGQC